MIIAGLKNKKTRQELTLKAPTQRKKRISYCSVLLRWLEKIH